LTININHELYVFFISFICGIICSAIFDFFRISRKRYKQKTFLINISDILFWIISCIICYGCIFFTNSGKIRLYEFIAIAIGGFIYFLLLNRFFNIVFVNFFKIIEIILKILLTPPRFLYKIIIYTKKLLTTKFREKKTVGGKNELTEINKENKKLKSRK